MSMLIEIDTMVVDPSEVAAIGGVVKEKEFVENFNRIGSEKVWKLTAHFDIILRNNGASVMRTHRSITDVFDASNKALSTAHAGRTMDEVHAELCKQVQPLQASAVEQWRVARRNGLGGSAGV